MLENAHRPLSPASSRVSTADAEKNTSTQAQRTGRKVSMKHTATSAAVVDLDPGQSTAAASASPVHVVTVDPDSDDAERADNADSPPCCPPSASPASSPDKRTYAGSLLTDVVRYRVLRAHALDGSGLTDDEIGALSSLDAKLRQRPQSDVVAAERRYYRRYDCAFDAELEYEAEGHKVVLAVAIEDLGAGGARIHADRCFEPGQPVTLAVQIAAATSVCTVRLPARVAWSREKVAGLMFAGAPVRMANGGHFECSAARR